MEGNPNLQRLLSSGIWPPKAGQHLAVQFYDGTKVCEVADIPTSEEMLEVEVIVFDQFTLDIDHNMSLWQMGGGETVTVLRDSVLPVRPQVEVVPSLSRMTRSGRRVVVQVENFDVIHEGLYLLTKLLLT